MIIYSAITHVIGETQKLFYLLGYIDSDVMFQKNINDVKRLVEVGWCLIKLCGCWVLKAD